MAKKIEQKQINSIEVLVATLELANEAVKHSMNSLSQIKKLEEDGLYYVAGGLSIIQGGLNTIISFLEKKIEG